MHRCYNIFIIVYPLCSSTSGRLSPSPVMVTLLWSVQVVILLTIFSLFSRLALPPVFTPFGSAQFVPTFPWDPTFSSIHCRQCIFGTVSSFFSLGTLSLSSVLVKAPPFIVCWGGTAIYIILYITYKYIYYMLCMCNFRVRISRHRYVPGPLFSGVATQTPLTQLRQTSIQSIYADV